MIDELIHWSLRNRASCWRWRRLSSFGAGTHYEDAAGRAAGLNRPDGYHSVKGQGWFRRKWSRW